MNDEYSDLEIGMERHDDTVVVTLHGQVAELEVHRLETALLNQIEAGAVKMILDLSDIRFLTSSGLGVFMHAFKRARAENGYLHLVAPQPLVRQIIETTRLQKLFSIYDTVEAARAVE